MANQGNCIPQQAALSHLVGTGNQAIAVNDANMHQASSQRLPPEVDHGRVNNDRHEIKHFHQEGDNWVLREDDFPGTDIEADFQ